MKYTIKITFDAVFRSWAVYHLADPAQDDCSLTPRLIIKTGFLCEIGSPQWPLSLHNFWVYDGGHQLLGTLEPLQPLPSGLRRFQFHRHSRNDHVELPGGYADMDAVIFELLELQGRGELAKG